MCDFEGKFLISNNHLIIFNSNFNHSIFWKTKTCPTINQGINICTIKVRKTKFFFKYSCISLKLVIAEKSNCRQPSAVNRFFKISTKFQTSSNELYIGTGATRITSGSRQSAITPSFVIASNNDLSAFLT